MTFTYYNNIPFENNDPKNDQPRMKTNTGSISGLFNVNHIGFNQIGGGTHRRIDFLSMVAPGAPSGVQSVIYPGAGTAVPAVPEAYFRNVNAILPVSVVRAFCSFQATGAPALLNSFNVASISKVGTDYRIVINANLVADTNPCIIITGSANYVPSYAFGNLSATTLELFNVPDNSHVSVAFLEI